MWRTCVNMLEIFNFKGTPGRTLTITSNQLVTVCFEVEPCACVCVRMIWVTSSHLVLALWSQACFLFSPPLPRKLLPPSGTGLWKAGQVSPTRMAWKYSRIHPAVLSLCLNSAADSDCREQGCGIQRPFMGQHQRLSMVNVLKFARKRNLVQIIFGVNNQVLFSEIGPFENCCLWVYV